LTVPRHGGRQSVFGKAMENLYEESFRWKHELSDYGE
jgi:hypothetical protein